VPIQLDYRIFPLVSQVSQPTEGVMIFEVDMALVNDDNQSQRLHRVNRIHQSLYKKKQTKISFV
jgi:hypothetical protein